MRDKKEDMKQGEVKLKKEKGQEKKVGLETGLRHHRIGPQRPSTRVIDLETGGKQR